jgi:hypothetical protein
MFEIMVFFTTLVMLPLHAVLVWGYITQQCQPSHLLGEEKPFLTVFYGSARGTLWSRDRLPH